MSAPAANPTVEQQTEPTRLDFYKNLARRETKQRKRLTTALTETNKALTWAIETLDLTSKALTDQQTRNEDTLKENNHDSPTH